MGRDRRDVIAGRYSLDEQIGRGGTGAVWRGRDEVLGRTVALKRIGLLPGDDHPDVARAEREARLSARLNHPHVVAVFDMVHDEESDEHWLVMEYVDGRTLSRLVQDRGPLSPDDAAPLLWQVADGLTAAHGEGITHRDVKPSNVLIDADGNAKILDFGIARVETDASLTRTGLMTGSPAYLAPEIASGHRGDSASDVWSLGATTFHVLAGRPPYEIGDHVLGALYRIVNDDPPRLDDAGWMAPLLENTMVKDPAQRWSMEQVREFLSRPHSSVVPTPEPTMAMVPPYDDGHTQVLDGMPAAAAAAAAAPVALATQPVTEPTAHPLSQPVSGPATAHTPWRPSRNGLLVLAGAAAVLLVVVLALVLGQNGSSDPQAASKNPAPTKSSQAPARPTAQGMEKFIRSYVTTVSDNPSQAWTMLTPKFQRESGGFDRYRSFWDNATNGQVLDITADPKTMSVSYHVHFDNFDNGPGPTVLDLKFVDGHYLIDGEHTAGFHPAAEED